MFCINVVLTVNDPSNVDRVHALLVEASGLSRDEPGCQRFEVYHSQSDPAVFILCERWDSEQALDDHRNGKAYREIYQPKVLPCVERVAHICTLVE